METKTTQEQPVSILPGENIVLNLLKNIEVENTSLDWDKGYPPSHDVHHNTHYHDHHQTIKPK